MQCLDDHHHYVLKSFENPEEKQELRFINKKPLAEGSSELQTVHDGTTNEEVLKMLIHRTGELAKKFPCRENSLAITKMEEALMWFEKRTANRVARGVEGQHKA